jgi:ABC-type sugar transport system ATPase subunit
VDGAALTCSHVSKSFGATRAVSDITFSLAPGEVLALVGENGAGKSTLMNIVSGGLAPDAGTVTVAAPGDGRGRSVAMVHQELSLFANLTVSENLELDRPAGGAMIDERASRAAAVAVMRDLGIEVDVDATLGDLSPGQRQLVEVAKAIAVPPRLLVLDEPTSSLEGPQVDLLFAAVRRLAAAGTAVVFVSHRIEELFEICDRVLVMRDGAQVAFDDVARLTRHSLVELMVGRESNQLYPDRPTTVASTAPRIALRNVSVALRIVDVSLDFPGGAVTAIAGLEGHGQALVAEVVAGALTPTSGEVLVEGTPVRLPSPRSAVRRGIGYVPPDRRLEGLLLEKSVAANLILAAARRLFRFGLVTHRRERSATDGVVQRLAVKCSSTAQPVLELSGGNQQKVLLGRWLLHDELSVLVLNDPTRGVDVGSRAQIYAVIRELADRGVAVVLVSTDLQEILGLSDQVYVMYSGRVTGRLDTADATEASVMHLATGGGHGV